MEARPWPSPGIIPMHRAFPDCERYGITSQLRRAAISVASNIAEGTGRVGNRDQARFLQIARGSVCEMECQLLLARDIGYVTSEAWSVLDKRCREVGKMLNGLIRSLSRERRPKLASSHWEPTTGDRRPATGD